MHMLNNESLDVFVNKTSVKKRQIVFLHFQRNTLFWFWISIFFVQGDKHSSKWMLSEKNWKFWYKEKITMCTKNPMGFPLCYCLRISEHLVYLLPCPKLIELIRTSEFSSGSQRLFVKCEPSYDIRGERMVTSHASLCMWLSFSVWSF